MFYGGNGAKYHPLSAIISHVNLTALLIITGYPID